MPAINITIKHGTSRDAAKKNVEHLARRIKKDLGSGEWEWVEDYALEGSATGIKKFRVSVNDKTIHLGVDPSIWVSTAYAREQIMEAIDAHFPQPA